MKTDSAIARPERARIPNLEVLALGKIIGQLAFGTLEIVLPNGQQLTFEGKHHPEVRAQWRVLNMRAIRRLISSGAVGFAEGYLEGDWTTPSLPDLMRLAAHNDASMSDRTQGLWLSRLLNRLQHLANNNSRSRAKRNIAYHYDLGNDFYSAWLDESMTYSSALFRHSDMSLVEAQAAKLDRLIEVADIQGHVSVLEIGCGWGSFLERAAGHTAGSVTGISISERQCEYARQRLATRDIANATVAFRDYRDMTGTFDRIVSIEMFEAVGEAYWSTYAAALKRLLSRNGKAALQVITIDESRFDQYRRSADFIQRYIFPGGMLPTKEKLNNLFKASGLRVTDTLSFGHDYAKTLECWRHEFHAKWPTLRTLGFDEKFRRMWDYYFAYCEGGFLAGSVDVVQIGVEHD